MSENLVENFRDWYDQSGDFSLYASWTKEELTKAILDLNSLEVNAARMAEEVITAAKEYNN